MMVAFQMIMKYGKYSVYVALVFFAIMALYLRGQVSHLKIELSTQKAIHGVELGHMADRVKTLNDRLMLQQETIDEYHELYEETYSALTDALVENTNDRAEYFKELVYKENMINNLKTLTCQEGVELMVDLAKGRTWHMEQNDG